jgi:hypothetical protein
MKRKTMVTLLSTLTLVMASAAYAQSGGGSAGGGGSGGSSNGGQKSAGARPDGTTSVGGGIGTGTGSAPAPAHKKGAGMKARDDAGARSNGTSQTAP